jgi:ferredoxin
VAVVPRAARRRGSRKHAGPGRRRHTRSRRGAALRRGRRGRGPRAEAFIESARCTSCNECTNLNKKLFAYNDKKQAYVKDAKAGPSRTSSRRGAVPVSIIHLAPLNLNEKD